MGLHSATIQILEDSRLCDNVMKAVRRNYSRRYIQQRYGVSRRQLERIIQVYSDQMASGHMVRDGRVDTTKQGGITPN